MRKRRFFCCPYSRCFFSIQILATATDSDGVYGEGKKGGEFYTPSCIVNLIAEMIEPYKGKI